MARAPAVLLISPGIMRWQDVDFGVPHLVALGGYLIEHTGVRVEIVDLNYEGGDRRDLCRRLDELGPFLMIGVSAYSSFDVLRVLSLARFLRDRYPGVPLVTGGYHASALPGDLRPHFDVVVPGEGEIGMRQLVETLLGGGEIEPGVLPPAVVPDLDALPPYRWELLQRYWPHATWIGRKLQIYLSRGCPYRCAFCMERAKSGYSWRAFSPERALDELQRLSTFTDLGMWTVNIADPLFGFRRRWRRQVLQGIVDRGIAPMHFWTLTRSDDLGDEDIQLLARARFAIGIGLESGSPEMLAIMQKGNTAERYLQAVEGLARRSQRHGLNWAVNVIVGHPGETPATAAQTAAFLKQLFLDGPSSHGWLSVDPFRLYPGSQVHQEQAHYEREHGTRFYHPRWWMSWYDGPFRAQHLDPSREMDYAARVDWMVATYGPLVRRIHERFEGPGGTVGAIYARSQQEQVEVLSPQIHRALIDRAKQAAGPDAQPLAVPIGLDLKDEVVRRLEAVIRARLDRGMVVADRLVGALLAVSPGRFLPRDEALRIVDSTPHEPAVAGAPPAALGLSVIVMGLQALAPASGERAVDLCGGCGYVAALLAELVGEQGSVVAVADSDAHAVQLRAVLQPWPQVRIEVRSAAQRVQVAEPADLIWLGAAVPRVPEGVVRGLTPTGRALVVAGPRFRDQDLLVVSPDGTERVLSRVRVPVLGGPQGWIPAPERPQSKAGAPPTEVVAWPAPQRLFAVLATADLSDDVAGLGPGSDPDSEDARRLRARWHGAPGRNTVQALGLIHGETSALVRALRHPPEALADPAGRALCEALAAAVETEACDVVEPAGELVELRSVLQDLRAQLWAPQGREAPPLVLMHVPALGGRARATEVDGVRRVATSLDQPFEHVLMQVLHEEMHPITDPIVREEHGGGAARDTRPGTPGHALHEQLEAVAVQATQAFLASRAPQWLPAFRTWIDHVEGRSD
ncbi:MAG: radical SAM protein [Myxococcales bacterium]|nr:radical SAM protein [Myxococcales bacterium]